MTPARTPDVVAGSVPGLLCRGMPCRTSAGHPVIAYATHESPDIRDDWIIDWSDRAATTLAILWLADRGHLCGWMLPTTHGGKVAAHAGLTAWEVSAILVARSVVRVARGDRPVDDLYHSEDLRRHIAWSTQSGITVHWTRADHISKTWAFAAPSGILLPD